MDIVEERQLIPVRVLQEEQEEIKELPLEALDVPMSQILRTYKNREIPRRWSPE